MNGIPLYQIMEIHEHVKKISEILPRLDLLIRSEPGSGTMAGWRQDLANLTDDQVTDLVRALAGLHGCARIIGMVQIPLHIFAEQTPPRVEAKRPAATCRLGDPEEVR